ncbi:transposase [uncultured Treponema sp.]|uniref:IS110 family transposase n=1 Tax=uncultured Treponema sp. TaxID=162155 RepID=UPI00280BD04C|nr:transposase [uncultured Treponema sp.]
MAPTSIAKTSKDKMLKTDRADAQMLARPLAYHSYKQVVLPTENILTLKEVVRLRSAVLKSCKKAKQNLLSFYSITESHILAAEGNPTGR